uniref:TAFA chemokine like family member 5b n=1 Tax=Oryzias melastigma TaxID=30732 RepID=A0A3B3CH90_ORYME
QRGEKEQKTNKIKIAILFIAGTCEVVTLDEDRSQPWRTVNRQSVRCACRKGQMAGTIRARPACVDEGVVRTQRWCEMSPCLKDEACHLLDQRSGWICSQPGGRVKTTTVRLEHLSICVE